MTSVQTQIFENGEWVTRTLTAEELMGTNVRSLPAAREPLGNTPKAPKYGLLTRTIIDSPIIRWVHPAQLRSSRFNDVALVGDKSVQICELGTDMELRPVAKRLDFGSRIRNCRVIGTHEYLKTVRENIQAKYLRGGDVNMADTRPPTSDSPLFQQILVLALSTGELVFLFMTPTAAGGWEFVSSVFTVAGERLIDPGFHMAISPDSNYLALACSEDLFIVYQLETVEELRNQHREGSPIQPFRSKFARAVNGIILKFDFLYPEHASQVILLVIMVKSGVSRLVIYEWDKTEPLALALHGEERGHRLDESAGLPLLVIPLTVGCQFLMVTEHSMATYTDVLSGPPTPIPFGLNHRDKSDWYYGTHAPMWTAWTRPMREESFLEDTDVIWLAREDGWVSCLEIRGECGVENSIFMGPLKVTIDSTFAFLSIPGGEVLVVVGDHGPGGVWTVRPRENITPVDSIQNWSPTVDMVLMKGASKDPKSDQSKLKKRSRSTEKARARSLPPDRVFACAGRGTTGAIVELRYGIQANIGLDLSYPSPIRRCWAVPNFEDVPNPGFFMLLALPQRSALLHISHDHSEVSEKDQDAANFDLLSTTIAVYSSRDLVIQITATNVTIVSAQSCYQHSISDMIDDSLATVTYAAVTNQLLALSVYSNAVSSIRIFTFDNTRFVLQQGFEVDGEITALSVNTLLGVDCVLAGLWREDQSTLAVFPIESPTRDMQMAADSLLVPMKSKSGVNEPENRVTASAVTSIVCLSDEKILVGMRNGDVLSIQSTSPGQFRPDSLNIRTSYFGLFPSYVFTGIPLDGAESVLVCNDAGLAIIKEPRWKPGPSSFEQIFRVWPTDASDRGMPSPTINSVASLHQIPDYDENTLVMISGSRILVTQLRCDAVPVPWYIPVSGAPKGLLYSERLKALVTVVVKNGLASLHFLDPTTGADLSRPVKKVKDQAGERQVDIDYIAYMGHPDIKVVSLLTWRYKQNDKLYEWFVILTMCGERTVRILVVSAEEEEPTANTGSPRRIRFWTQFDRKVKDAKIRAAATDDSGIFFSFEKSIEYFVIEDKKFKEIMRYDTQSPAIHLEVVDGRLHALTSHHSLVIFDYSSRSAIESNRMQPVHRDDTARNGLYAMDVSSVVGGLKDHEHFNLVSDPMCSVYGLWSPDTRFDSANFRLTFQAELTATTRRFGRGRTRPHWTRGQPRYGRLRATARGLPDTASDSDDDNKDKGKGKEKEKRMDKRKANEREKDEKENILGLALDGSLTQFSILDENEWRLLKYIQNLAMSCKEICVITREKSAAYRNNNKTYNSLYHKNSNNSMIMDDENEDDLILFDTAYSAGPKHMHVDGDILQRCLDNRALERIFPSGSEKLGKLRELIGEVLIFADGDGDGDSDGGENEAGKGNEVDEVRVYEFAYALLEYYLAPAL